VKNVTIISKKQTMVKVVKKQNVQIDKSYKQMVYVWIANHMRELKKTGNRVDQTYVLLERS